MLPELRDSARRQRRYRLRPLAINTRRPSPAINAGRRARYISDNNSSVLFLNKSRPGKGFQMNWLIGGASTFAKSTRYGSRPTRQVCYWPYVPLLCTCTTYQRFWSVIGRMIGSGEFISFVDKWCNWQHEGGKLPVSQRIMITKPRHPK